IRKADEDRQAQERKEAEERAATERAAAEQKAREDAERRKREQEAEAKKVAEAQNGADDKRKAEEAKQAAEREAEVRRSLEGAEAQLRSSGALARWLGQIGNRIQRAWIRPPTAKPGIDCMVYVTQVPGGEVTNVRVGQCNGDAAVRQSIESAVLRASPLPPP